jgi:uncharacterized protein
METGTAVAVPDENAEAFRLDERHLLDIREALRQYIIAQMPMKPLCRPDCKGLCPECGTDRNTRTCSCTQRRLDPRWSALSQVGPPKNQRVSG